MERYLITIIPSSSFGTPIKGDTLFGQVCWQVVHSPELVADGLEHVLNAYHEAPFAVFSSAFPIFQSTDGIPCWLLPRPSLPEKWVFPSSAGNRRESYQMRKDRKAKKWLLLREGDEIRLPSSALETDEEAISTIFPFLEKSIHRSQTKWKGKKISTQYMQPHNTINRNTNTTGKGMFAPYVIGQRCFFPGIKLGLIVLISTNFTDIERITEAVRRIGSIGLGRDATIGAGKFRVQDVREIHTPLKSSANGLYTMAPSVPDPSSWEKVYFNPFTRFGKHGDSAAVSAHPFKAPVIMADEGAVLLSSAGTTSKIPYIGKAVTGISLEIPSTVSQGYAPVIPVTLEA